MTAPKSVLIVGGGVVGLCTAYYARLRGHDVTVVDRSEPGHEGCSFGNAGYIVPSHFVPLAAPGMVALGLKWMWNPESPFYVRPRLDRELWSWGWKFHRACTREHVERSAPLIRDLNLASRACFEDLGTVPGLAFGLEKKGLLCLCRTEERLHEEQRTVEEARALGLEARVLTPREAAELEPALRMEIVGAVHFPQDCHLTPSRFMTSMRALLEKSGVRLLGSTEVLGARKTGRRVDALETSRGKLEADEIVLSAGSWSSRLAACLDLKLPMQPGKGYSLTLPSPRRLPSTPCLLTEARVAVTPMGSSLRFAGTMELAGLDETINPARVRGILKSVPKYFPELGPSDFAGVAPWCGLRPCSPDGLPYVGRSRAVENLVVGTGHAMMGMSLGPITGKVIAEILSGERPSIALDALSPDRHA